LVGWLVGWLVAWPSFNDDDEWLGELASLGLEKFTKEKL